MFFIFTYVHQLLFTAHITILWFWGRRKRKAQGCLICCVVLYIINFTVTSHHHLFCRFVYITWIFALIGLRSVQLLIITICDCWSGEYTFTRYTLCLNWDYICMGKLKSVIRDSRKSTHSDPVNRHVRCSSSAASLNKNMELDFYLQTNWSCSSNTGSQSEGWSCTNTCRLKACWDEADLTATMTAALFRRRSAESGRRLTRWVAAAHISLDENFGDVETALMKYWEQLRFVLGLNLL